METRNIITAQAHKPTSAPLPIPPVSDSQNPCSRREGKKDSTREQRMITQAPAAARNTGPPSLLTARKLQGRSSTVATTPASTHLAANDFISKTRRQPQRKGSSVAYQ